MSRYALDKTGVNPDNLVCEDVVDIGTNAIRIISPRYGAYFSESLMVWDQGVRLTPGIDYKPEEFLLEESMLTAKEIVKFISIINPEVSSSLKIHRQVLGGNYQSNNDVAADLFEAAANDIRPVHYDDILGKPTEFNPAWHPHSAPSVFNWGALVAAVDRLSSTVNVGNTPSFQILIDYIDSSIRKAQKVFEDQHLPASESFDGFIDERGMSMSSILYIMATGKIPSVIFFQPVRSEYICNESTGVIYFEIFSTKECGNLKLNWEVIHFTTDELDFEYTKGPIMNYKTGAILEIMINNTIAFHEKYFEISITDQDGKRVSLMMGDVRASDYLKDKREVERSFVQNTVQTAETLFLDE